MCESVDAIGDEPQAIWHCDIFEYDPVNIFNFRQITKKWDDGIVGINYTTAEKVHSNIESAQGAVAQK